MSDVIDRIEAAGPDPEAWCGTATVTDAAPPPTSDGRLQVTVDWQGTSVTCGYLASYTPTLGHHVTFLKAGATFLVLGHPATTS